MCVCVLIWQPSKPLWSATSVDKDFEHARDRPAYSIASDAVVEPCLTDEDWQDLRRGGRSLQRGRLLGEPRGVGAGLASMRGSKPDLLPGAHSAGSGFLLDDAGLSPGELRGRGKLSGRQSHFLEKPAFGKNDFMSGPAARFDCREEAGTGLSEKPFGASPGPTGHPKTGLCQFALPSIAAPISSVTSFMPRTE